MTRVILLHGLARSSASLSRLEGGLQSAGFSTLNVDYPSRKQSISRLADELQPSVARFAGDGTGCLHFVGHSMGGLLARAYINRHRPTNLGRVVMLGPPNQGSEIADLLEDRWLYRKAFGPAGLQLSTGANRGIATILGLIDYPLGVIAGDRSIDPLGWLLIPGPNDGKVSVERTKAAGMTDHVTLHATHALMAGNESVIRHTIEFLQTGRFPRSPPALTGVKPVLEPN